VIITEEGTENVVTLNDKVYDGKEITADGKYILKVVSKDSMGNTTESVVKFEIVNKVITPEPENPTIPEPENPSNPDLPQTGSMIGSGLIAIGGIVAVAAGVVISKKRKKEDN
ncbi:LPXTG cell wall anchor domain-containing protein, partial [Clostridium sp.]